MTGVALDEVSAFLPPTVSIASLRESLELSVAELRVFQRFYGLESVCRDPGGLTDLMLGAAGNLTGLRGREHRVRYVLQARTLPLVAPYSVNAVHDVRAALGLRRAQAFTVTQHACASGLLAVDLAGKLLAADGDPDALAIVFTGEKAFTLLAQRIPDTTIMGEGAAACLVRLGGTRDRLLAYATRTDSRFNDLAGLPADLATHFQQIYAGTLAEVMKAALAEAGLGFADVALVLPHNVNRISWVRLCRQVGLPVERVFLGNIPSTGHCFCADSFINHVDASRLGLLNPGDHYVMAAVGLGATFSAMVFRH